MGFTCLMLKLLGEFQLRTNIAKLYSFFFMNFVVECFWWVVFALFYSWWLDFCCVDGKNLILLSLLFLGLFLWNIWTLLSFPVTLESVSFCHICFLSVQTLAYLQEQFFCKTFFPILLAGCLLTVHFLSVGSIISLSSESIRHIL